VWKLAYWLTVYTYINKCGGGAKVPLICILNSKRPPRNRDVGKSHVLEYYACTLLF